MYKKITNKNDIDILQKNMDTLREWAVENGMKINTSKSKTTRFARSGDKNPLAYSLVDQKILEASSYKYLVVTFRSDLSWVDQVNYIVQKSLEDTSLCNECSQRRKYGYKKFILHVIETSYS